MADFKKLLRRIRAADGRETQNLAHAVQSSSNAVLLLDAQGCIAWVNQGFSRISGYTLEEALGASPDTLLGSGLSDASALAQLEHSRAQARPCRVELCNRHKNGQSYWVDIDFRPDFDRRGKLLGFIEICTDITELKQAKRSLQASLLESEALRRTLDTHAIVSVADRAGLIIEANAAFCAISGYRREQLIGNNHRLLNSGTHGAAFWQTMWDTIARGQSWRGEICNRDSQGQLYWVDSMIAPFLAADGQVEKYVSIRMDITARKRLELQLNDTQERMRLATESAGIGIWSVDLLTGLSSWDAQQHRLFGLEPTDRPVSDVQWLAAIHPQDRERVTKTFVNAVDTGASFAHSYRILLPDGALRHIKSLGSPRRNAQGQVDYIVGTNMDVTDATLLTESIQVARDRAEEASRIKGQFMANMSHEIRTPMNAVLGQLRLLEYTVVDARQQAYVTQAERASRLMLRMIDSVLDYSKLEADRMQLHCEAFRVDDWLDELAGALAGEVGDKDINVLFDVPQSLPDWLVGDRRRLQQVLFYLLDNAIKFTAKGEVVCQISVLQQSAASCQLAFCVRDTGIGMAPDLAHSMFADFVQLESGSTRAYGGVGLGLSVAQRLVQLMGGTIAVQSQPGAGSRFFFTLELALPAESPQAQPGLSADQLASTVLVVDACATARALIASLAASLHGPVETAPNCTQALEQVRRRLEGAGPPFTLVLLDWNMPDADSWQTLQQLRALYRQGQHEQPLVFMLSNNSNEALQTRLVDREGLANGFLAKPFTAGMLGNMLQRARAAERHPFVAPVQTARLQGLRVLVVEDNLINQRVMQQMLETEGASVRLAGNGQQGVDAVRACPPGAGFDLVLMDIQMPVMDGYQASREIRRELADNQLPIVAVSANVQASDRAHSLAAGMNVHIGKPYVLDELVAVMRQLTGMAAAPAPVKLPAPVLPAAEPAQTGAAPLLQACWISGPGQSPRPDAALLQQQGVLLQPLDSVAELALQLAGDPAQAMLVVADLATASSAPMIALRASNGASMKTMALLVLAEAASAADMQACIRAGALDMVLPAYAREHLGALAGKHINAQGELRVDLNNKVMAIDSQGAMARIQSDLPFFGSLLRAFFDELPQRRQLLREAWSQDPDQVHHRSHALKGLAATLGLGSLEQVARQAEERVQQPGQAAAEDAGLLLQLEGEMQSARFQILRWLALHPDAEAVAP